MPAFLPTPELAAWQRPGEHGRPALFARTAGDLLFAEGQLCRQVSATNGSLRSFAVVALGPLGEAPAAALAGAEAALQKAGLHAAAIHMDTALAMLGAWKRVRHASSTDAQVRARHDMTRLRLQLLREMATQGVDVLLCPASERSAAAMVAGVAEADRQHALLLSLLDGPAGGVPFLCEEDGTVASVLIAAPPFQDARCLEAMVLLERRSVVLFAMRSLRDESEEVAESVDTKFSGFPPTDERRRFLFMHHQKFGNYGCMDREQELMPRPMF